MTRIDHKTRINAFVMTADNELVLGDEDGRVVVFGVLTGEALREAKQPTSRCARSPVLRTRTGCR